MPKAPREPAKASPKTAATKSKAIATPALKPPVGEADAAEAARLPGRGTNRIDPAAPKAMLDGTAAAVAASTDPMVTLARRIEPIDRELRAWNEVNIANVEAANGSKIAQARFAVFGRSMPPDANGQLRLCYGVVKGYAEDTTLVPFRTTFFGLYDRALSFSEVPPLTVPSLVHSAALPTMSNAPDGLMQPFFEPAPASACGVPSAPAVLQRSAS